MEQRVGKVTHFYTHLCVAVLELSGELRVGDEIHILGHITDFTQLVELLEIEHKKVLAAGAGVEVAGRSKITCAWEMRVYEILKRQSLKK